MADRVDFAKAAPEHGLAVTAYTVWLETQLLGRVEQLDDGEGPRYWLAWQHRSSLAVGAEHGGPPTPFASRTEAGDKLLALYRQRRPRPRLAVTDLARQPAGMHKVYDGPFEFPGLHRGQVCRCRLRVYQEPGWAGIVAIATEQADNPGASITNAAEQLCTRIWQEFRPDKAHPPLLVDHYCQASYGPGGRKGDEFSLVHFHELHNLGGNLRPFVSHPRWQWVPGSMVARLVGEPQNVLGDGFDRKLDPLDPGNDWMEQEI